MPWLSCGRCQRFIFLHIFACVYPLHKYVSETKLSVKNFLVSMSLKKFFLTHFIIFLLQICHPRIKPGTPTYMFFTWWGVNWNSTYDTCLKRRSFSPWHMYITSYIFCTQQVYFLQPSYMDKNYICVQFYLSQYCFLQNSLARFPVRQKFTFFIFSYKVNLIKLMSQP